MSRCCYGFAWMVVIASVLLRAGFAQEVVSQQQVSAALKKAVGFFHSHVSSYGGYVWRYSGDLSLREGEGKASKTMIWVQPPGTPTVGEAFLDAYEVSGDSLHLDAARDAAYALLLGQVHSGGWFYYVDFEAEKRQGFSYRYDTKWRGRPDPTEPQDRASASGWDVWRKRKYKSNLTILDDDTTQAALRFLMRMDRVLGFRDERIHGAVEYGLASLLNAQYANGAWSANRDRFQERAPDAEYYPRKRASYPASWSRKWTKDFAGCYVINDDLMANMVKTMLVAYDVYGEEQYQASAEKAGEFLLLAQMPEPQPAWAQQYDRDMHPVWDRSFEPPAISGGESQAVLEALMLLCRKTGKKKYLEPIPASIAYLRRSQLPDGRLARFYELRTNRPLYFTRGRDRRHEMTYSSDRLATNYAFIVESRLNAIEAEYRRVRAAEPSALRSSGERQPAGGRHELAERVRDVIGSMDKRGVWVEGGRLKAHKVEPESGVIDSRTFAGNVKTLCRFLTAEK